MSRNITKKEAKAFFYISIVGFVLYAIVKLFKIIINLSVDVGENVFSFCTSPSGLVLMIFIVVGIITYFSFFPVYEFFYYKSKQFLAIKNSIDKNIKECNLLNQHIESLKSANIKIKSTDFGISDYRDESVYKYKRSELKKMQYNENVYDCSLSVCKNAQQQPFRYLCKYFDFEISEDFLINLENILNDFSAAEQGKVLLIQERDRIIDTIKTKIPFLLIRYRNDKLIEKLGFEFVEFNQPYFPKYSFRYVSPGGNSSMVCDVVLDIENIEKFIVYMAKLIDYKNSIKGQRVLMTTQLREKIKNRDNYTCQHCGLSIYNEPNLLLEIDHIIPLSKGGITEESNLQTLCWKCNRHKGSKIIRHQNNY